MKRDPSWIKFYGIGGGTTEPVDIGGGSSNDKLPKAVEGIGAGSGDQQAKPGI